MKDYVYYKNKVTGEMDRYVKVYYIDEYGFDHIQSYDKNYELFKGHKIAYYTKRSKEVTP